MNRFRQIFKNAFILFIGIQAFLSCSTPEPDLPPPAQEYAYCVYVEAQKCFQGPYTECPGGGLPTNDCPFENSSGGGDPSYAYCVYVEAQSCFPGPYTACPGGGLPANECPFESLGGGDASSSSGGGDDLPEYAYCVYSTEGLCLNGPVTYCLLGGTLSNICPFPTNVPSSSSIGGGGASSSSVSGSVVSSSSVSVVPASSSSAGGGVIGNGPVSYYGELKASGNKLVGSKTGTAQAVQVRGVSLGWSNTGWESASFFNAATVNAMVDDWKAEIIRVPIGYANSSAGEYGGSYLADPTGNKARVKAAIDAAISKGVYVIIDWHTHVSNVSDANTYFAEMARDYGNYDNVIFEIFNEPLSVTWSSIKTYATSVISTIRQYSDNLVLVGTPNWDQDVDDVVGNTLADDNVAYVAHFYAASHPLNGGTYSPNFASRINSVRNTAGKPVFVSEYGTVSADGNGSHNKSASDTWMTFLNTNNISYCAWHVNNKNEASAFFSPSFTPSASAGWTSTANMTASGQYIYSNLVSWANSAPWRTGGFSSNSGTPSSSSGGSSGGLYCDFGVFNSYGGGCYIISSPSECDIEYGTVRDSCPRKQYCDFGPETSYGGGCFQIEDANDCDLEYGTLTNSCGSPGYNGGGSGKWCVDHDFRDCINDPYVTSSAQTCAYEWGGVLQDSCPAGYERYEY